MKDELKGQHALLKLVLFKGIIFIDLIQASLFPVLLLLMYLHQPLKSSISIPLSVLRHLRLATRCSTSPSCSSERSAFLPIKLRNKAGRAHKHSVGKAIIDLFNVIDTLRGFTFMFRAMSLKSFGRR